MKAKRSLWTTITGSVTSTAPILFACCKSGACVGVCASPIASLFGVSSAKLASSPWMGVVEPILIALSAVSFTISYYTLYVLPKFNNCGPDACACEPTDKEKRRTKLNKFVFWFGLILSIGFLSYFEIQKYNSASANSECSTSCAPGACEEETSEACCTEGDSTACCSQEESHTATTADSTLQCKLTSKELTKRKETVLASLKTKIIEKKELANGWAFKFAGNDEILDELNSFVKSERSCCSFFTFGISASGDGKEVWLNLTGPKGAKEMIKEELGL